jgi:hypothetical protein
VSAGIDSEPWFAGPRAQWLCDTVLADDSYLDAVEAIMYPLVSALPARARERGFLYPEELPRIPATDLERLKRAIDALIP